MKLDHRSRVNGQIAHLNIRPDVLELKMNVFRKLYQVLETSGIN